MSIPNPLSSKENRLAIYLILAIVAMILIALLNSLTSGFISSPSTPSPSPLPPTPNLSSSPRPDTSSGFGEQLGSIQSPPDLTISTDPVYSHPIYHFQFQLPQGYAVFQQQPDRLVVKPRGQSQLQVDTARQQGHEITLIVNGPAIWEFSKSTDSHRQTLLSEFLTLNSYQVFQSITQYSDTPLTSASDSSITTVIYKPGTDRQQYVEITTGYSQFLQTYLSLNRHLSNPDIPKILQTHLESYQLILSSFKFTN